MGDVNLQSSTASGMLEADFNQIKDVIQDGGVNALLVAINQTAVTGNALSVTRDLASANTDSSLVYLKQLNAGDDKGNLKLVNYGGGVSFQLTDAAFTVRSELGRYMNIGGDVAGSNWFYRNLASASTGGPVLFIEQDNAGDDQDALSIQQDGTGQGMTVDVTTNTGTNMCARFRNTATSDTADWCFLQRYNDARGTNYFYRNLASGDTAGPVMGILNNNQSDDQATLALTQLNTGVKVIDFDGCTDKGTTHTTVAESILIEMPGGGAGYINFYT